jgi:hypothetical protein
VRCSSSVQSLLRDVGRQHQVTLLARPRAFLFLAISVLGMTASAGAPDETVAEFLLRLQEQSAAPLVKHCSAKVPSLKRPLEVEYKRFKTRFRKATAPLRKRIQTGDELAKPASRALISEFETMGAQDLAEVTGMDPLVFCPTLRENLSNATSEAIRRNMESAFAQYRAAARQGD